MEVIKKRYVCIDGKVYDYNIFVCGNREDKRIFKQKFIEESNREQRYLIKKSIPTKKWCGQKVKVFGYYKSYPKLFKGVVANNLDHPFQFYSIKLK